MMRVAGCLIALLGGLAFAGPPGEALRFTTPAGKQHALADCRGKIVVLEWTNYDCAFVKKHYDTRKMQNLQATYTGKGVVWYSLLAAKPGASGYLKAEAVAPRVKQLGAVPTAVLYDTDHAGVRAFGVDRSPSVVILDQGGSIAYQGAVDSIRSWLPEDVAKADNHIALTLDALLKRNPPPLAKSRAYGCRH